MTRREVLSLAGAAFAGADYRDYSKCLPDYLRGLAERAYRKRNAEIAKLTTPAAIRQRQGWVRDNFWKLTGGMPERTPLNARTTGVAERPGYRLEKVVYESRPGFLVTANLYIPTEGQPPYPGILFQMGHTTNGKAGDLYQRCCQGLAKLGYLVLGLDPQPRLPGRSSAGGSEAAGFGRTIRRRHDHHAAGRGGRPAPPTTPSRTSPAPARSVSIAGICSIPWRPSRCWSWGATRSSSGLIRPTTSPAAGKSSASCARSTRRWAARTGWPGTARRCRTASRRTCACRSTTGSSGG